MKKYICKGSIFASVFIFLSCKDSKPMNEIQPPIAKVKDTILEMHGDKRVDPYYWLNDRDNPEVIAYLEQENSYYQQITAHTKELQQTLFEEMKSRIKEDDSSVPYFYNGYYYQTKYEKGQEYPIYIRRKGNLTAKEEVLFNCNEMAKGKAYFQLGTMSVSPDNKLAAFATDVVSRRLYTIQIKNLETGEILADKIENANPNLVWAEDSKTIFYTTKNSKTLRSEKVYKHTIGQEAKTDEMVFFEKDETFDVFVSKTKSKKYILIGSNSTMTTEYQFLDANQPNGKFQVFQSRIRGLEYDIDHFDGNFYILTNHQKATNFKVMKTPENKTGVANWTNVIDHREDVLVEGIEIFKDYLVVEERSEGLNKIRIKKWDGTSDSYLPFESETYTASLGTNPDFNATSLRYSYQSLATPPSVMEYHMQTKEKKVLKEVEVLGGKFNKENYEEKRLWATASDGTKVPISIVYKKGIKLNGKNPLLQYAYGSYGYSLDARFDSDRLSLLDRGFVYAIAHIRGGEEMGRQWYEDGKLLKKKNTFTDFIDCSKFLITQKYTSPEHLYAMGGSAGGLLMGAVINMNPELYHGVIAAVPFVDVVTTMLDDSIPLTTSEYDEWGNPNDKVYYDYMKSYSPYDNIQAKTYPNLLVTTGLHDSQVQYWEPAKWVAKLRTVKENKNLIFLDTNMDAGHGGASGRFESLKETAKEYAFLLDLAGIKK
ncbi:MAG: S9 family peptidase [Flavobacterium sp.]